MSKRYLDKEDRHEQRCRRLGTQSPRCVVFEEADSTCLEEHHLAGEKYGDDRVTVCRNCHRKLSDDQLDHAPRLEPNPENKETAIGHFLHGVCDFLQMIIERLREYANWLISNAQNAAGSP